MTVIYTAMMEYNFNFSATGIGSLPHTNSDDACNLILSYPDIIPFWPQLAKRSKLESMVAQFTEGLSFLDVDSQGRIKVKTDDFDKSLERFYEGVLSGNLDVFAISADYAQGLEKFLDFLKQGLFSKTEFIKGQVTGPFTFSASIKNKDNQSATFNPMLMDAIVNGLGLKAAWQREQFRRYGKKTIIFFDEPYMSCFGSGFTPINPEEVNKRLTDLISPLKDKDTLLGIHCCGNTDWGLILEVGFDIVNFDAYEFIERFLLYAEQINSFLERGGTIAWGLVPTLQYNSQITTNDLLEKFQYGLDTLTKKGISEELILKRAIITPSCGMGGMSIADSEQVMELLLDTSVKLKQKYS